MRVGTYQHALLLLLHIGPGHHDPRQSAFEDSFGESSYLGLHVLPAHLAADSIHTVIAVMLYPAKHAIWSHSWHLMKVASLSARAGPELGHLCKGNLYLF